MSRSRVNGAYWFSKGENNSLVIHQYMALYVTKLSEHKQLTYQPDAKYCAYFAISNG